MRNIITIAFLVVLTVTSLFCTASAKDTPAVFAEIEGAKPDKYIKRVKDIPLPVRKVLAQEMHIKRFNMADSGGAWNATDSVSDSSLPFSRLIWAVEIRGYYIIHYETGGLIYGTHFLIGAVDDKMEEGSVLWTADARESYRDFPAFIAEFKKGRLRNGR